jgi:hypothetical protein
MSDATASRTTIRPDDAAHFGALAAEWWNPRGSSAMLHRLNPVRLRFLREAIDRIGAAIRRRGSRWRAAPRWMWAAAQGCSPNRSPGWERPSPASMPR